MEFLFSNKKYDLYKGLTCSDLCEAFTFLLEMYMCNLKAWSINKWYEFLWAQTVLNSLQIYFYIVKLGILCLTYTNQNMYDFIDMLNDTTRYLRIEC